METVTVIYFIDSNKGSINSSRIYKTLEKPNAFQFIVPLNECRFELTMFDVMNYLENSLGSVSGHSWSQASIFALSKCSTLGKGAYYVIQIKSLCTVLFECSIPVREPITLMLLFITDALGSLSHRLDFSDYFYHTPLSFNSKHATTQQPSRIGIVGNDMDGLASLATNIVQSTASLGININKLFHTTIATATTTSNQLMTDKIILQQNKTNIEVIKLLSEGGYGLVYVSRSITHPNVTYALKEITCFDNIANANALNELNMLKAVMNSQPNYNHIIPLLDFSIIEGNGFTIYKLLFPLYSCTCWDKIEEYMNYTNKRIDSTCDDIQWPFPEEIAIQVIHGVAVALRHIHTLGYSHRDMKPHNILLEYISDKRVNPVLMDLGSMCIGKTVITGKKHAQVIQEQAELHTSPAYRPPELVSVPYTPYLMSLITGAYDDTIVITEAVDIWSMGCVIYALAFGLSPFESLKTGILTLGIMNGSYSMPPTAICPRSPLHTYPQVLCSYSAEYVQLIKKCIVVNFNKRPSADMLCKLSSRITK